RQRRAGDLHRQARLANASLALDQHQTAHGSLQLASMAKLHDLAEPGQGRAQLVDRVWSAVA
ncbi:MAG: hypothetical protein ACK550_08445, partial [Synechococcaceae cyanobacterium]